MMSTSYRTQFVYVTNIPLYLEIGCLIFRTTKNFGQNLLRFAHSAYMDTFFNFAHCALGVWIVEWSDISWDAIFAIILILDTLATSYMSARTNKRNKKRGKLWPKVYSQLMDMYVYDFLPDWIFHQHNNLWYWRTFQKPPRIRQCLSPKECEFQSSYSSLPLLNWYWHQTDLTPHSAILYPPHLVQWITNICRRKKIYTKCNNQSFLTALLFVKEIN